MEECRPSRISGKQGLICDLIARHLFVSYPLPDLFINVVLGQYGQLECTIAWRLILPKLVVTLLARVY
jgi:hypothetical protein